jgi:hypothetical protein
MMSEKWPHHPWEQSFDGGAVSDKPKTEAEVEDYLEDNNLCVCDHRKRSHHYRSERCMIPACGCTRYDEVEAVSERAKEVARELMQQVDRYLKGEIGGTELRERIAAAIDAAVAEQRERSSGSGWKHWLPSGVMRQTIMPSVLTSWPQPFARTGVGDGRLSQQWFDGPAGPDTSPG